MYDPGKVVVASESAAAVGVGIEQVFGEEGDLFGWKGNALVLGMSRLSADGSRVVVVLGVTSRFDEIGGLGAWRRWRSPCVRWLNVGANEQAASAARKSPPLGPVARLLL